MSSLHRPRRALWGDVRFLIGLLLVALSIAGVWLIVSAAGRTEPVLQASRTIVQGEALASGDFRVVEVGLGALADDYLAPQELRPGLVAARTLANGELMPRAVAVAADESRTTTMVVESSTRLPADVAAGTEVELWHAPPLDDGRAHDVPRILVADAVVKAVVTSEGVLSGSSTAVELVIDRADVADVLAAVTGGDLLSLVPAGAGT